jgi:hypothetical protein
MDSWPSPTRRVIWNGSTPGFIVEQPEIEWSSTGAPRNQRRGDPIEYASSTIDRAKEEGRVEANMSIVET